MERRITTPAMEVAWINAVWMWRLRVMAACVTGAFSIGLLALSLARLLNIEIINWPMIALWLVMGYESAVLWVLGVMSDIVSFFGLLQVAKWILATPFWVFDVVAVYVFVGGLVRLSEVVLYLKADMNTLNLGPDFINDAWAQTTWRGRMAASVDVAGKYLTWPARMRSDIREGHLKLAPALSAGLFVLTLVFLGGMVAFYG